MIHPIGRGATIALNGSQGSPPFRFEPSLPSIAKNIGRSCPQLQA